MYHLVIIHEKGYPSKYIFDVKEIRIASGSLILSVETSSNSTETHNLELPIWIEITPQKGNLPTWARTGISNV